MPRIIHKFAAVLLVTVSVPAWAAFIRGVVRFQDGRLADHIVVRLRSDKIAFQTETTTDPGGKFDFDGLTPSTYHLTIEGQGFRPYEAFIDITMSKMDYEEITLKPAKDPDAKAVPPEGPGASLNADPVPPAARKEYEAGQKLLDEKKDVEGSIKHYRKAIQFYDKYSEAHLALGLIYLDVGKYEEAQSALQRANELNPNAPGGFLALGAMLNRQKKFDDAEKALTHGLELKPDVPEGQYELAKAYWAIGKWQDAEPHAQKAVALAPTMAPVHVLLGNISLRRQDPLGAIKEFQEYLRLDPKGPMAGGVTQMIVRHECKRPKG